MHKIDKNNLTNTLNYFILMEEKVDKDVVIIGGGPGGYTAALHLAKEGRSVAIIERENIGGVCLNCGCIPSKALIHASDVFFKSKKNF